ncbi:MAG TPA: hypothetical protein PLP57_03105 [Candidatus Saccharicenans sp.]|jgi:hypothetical protein|nr:hypothetical protein [Candidatus Saccharicenans sp.]HRD01618.1 hypothetical protein [Candidatus Saccharicenans sp.]
MKNLRYNLLTAVIIALGLSLSGACSIIKHKEVNPVAKPLEKVTQKEVIELEEQPLVEADQALVSGQYAQALDIYKTQLDREPDNKKIQAAASGALEEIKRQSDQARIQDRHALAMDGYLLLLKDYDYFSRILPDLSFSPEELEQHLRECRLGNYLTQIEQSLKAKKYEQASNLLLEASKESPGDVRLKKQAERLLTELKSSGDKSLADLDFARAGWYYGLARKNWTKFKAYTGQLSFKLEDLSSAIKVCSQQLTNQGMIEYRKGNLKGAISIWESILTFDPENEQIKKAIQTARAQLQQIKG